MCRLSFCLFPHVVVLLFVVRLRAVGSWFGEVVVAQSLFMVKSFMSVPAVFSFGISFFVSPAHATDVVAVSSLIKSQDSYAVSFSEYTAVRSQVFSLGQQIVSQTASIKLLRKELAAAKDYGVVTASVPARVVKLQNRLGLKISYRAKLKVRLSEYQDLLFQTQNVSSKRFRAVQINVGKVLRSVDFSLIPDPSTVKPGYTNPVPAASAISTALRSVGVVKDSGYCLRFVGNSFGRFSGPASAYMVYKYAPAKIKHPGDFSPPPGALVVWSSAIGKGHGHVGLSIGDGYMVSTTWGPISVLPIEGFSDAAYLGWIPPYFYK